MAQISPQTWSHSSSEAGGQKVWEVLGRDSGSAGVSWSVLEVSWVSTEQTNPKIPGVRPRAAILAVLDASEASGSTVCFENLFLTPPEGQLSCVHVVNLGSKKTPKTLSCCHGSAPRFFSKKCVLATFTGGVTCLIHQRAFINY